MARRKKSNSDHEVLDITRASHMTTGGRRFNFRAVVVAGDGEGQVGAGVAQGKDVGQAIRKAHRLAEKQFIKVPIIDGTIPHQVEAKFGSAVLMLKPQAEGKGLIAGGPVRTVCRLVGIKSISSKIFSRTKSKMNIAQAAIKALSKLRDPDATT